MSHATVYLGRHPVKRIPRREIRRALRRLGISQNELARRIGKEQGMVSRAIRGEITSSVIWGRIRAFLANPETYTPPMKSNANDNQGADESAVMSPLVEGRRSDG